MELLGRKWVEGTTLDGEDGRLNWFVLGRCWFSFGLGDGGPLFLDDLLRRSCMLSWCSAALAEVEMEMDGMAFWNVAQW